MTGEPGVAVEHERVRVEGGPMAGPEGLGAAGTGMGAAGTGMGGGAPLAAGAGAGMGPGEGLAAHEGVGERAAHAAERAAGRAEAAVGPEVCGREEFVQLEDRPIVKERVERVVEHHPVEKQYVQETRFVGERPVASAAGETPLGVTERVVETTEPGPTCPTPGAPIQSVQGEHIGHVARDRTMDI